MVCVPDPIITGRKGMVAVLRNQVEKRVPGALSIYERAANETFCGGIAAVDEGTGGIPQGALTQICTPQGLSSGRTTVLLSLLARLTEREQFCALVDTSDIFDPGSAEAAAVDLSRLLWVRCRDKQMASDDRRRLTRTASVAGRRLTHLDAHGLQAAGIEQHFLGLCGEDKNRPARGLDGTLGAEAIGAEAIRTGTRAKHRLKPLEQAFKTADILVQNGGFGLIAVDLSGVEEQQVRKIPLSTWFRFARVVEKMPTALVFLMTYPAAQSCAALTLHVAGAESCWASRGDAPHTRVVRQLQCETEAGRARLRKTVQSARASFIATPIWA